MAELHVKDIFDDTWPWVHGCPVLLHPQEYSLALCSSHWSIHYRPGLPLIFLAILIARGIVHAPPALASWSLTSWQRILLVTSVLSAILAWLTGNLWSLSVARSKTVALRNTHGRNRHVGRIEDRAGRLGVRQKVPALHFLLVGHSGIPGASWTCVYNTAHTATSNSISRYIGMGT